MLQTVIGSRLLGLGVTVMLKLCNACPTGNLNGSRATITRNPESSNKSVPICSMESIPKAGEAQATVSLQEATEAQLTVKAGTTPISMKQRLSVEVGKKEINE